MKRITKVIAEETAVKLTVKKQEEIDTMKMEFDDRVFDVYMATVPDEIKKSSKNPNLKPYLEFGGSLTIDDEFCRQIVRRKDLFVKKSSYWTFNKFTKTEKSELIKLDQKIWKDEEKLATLKRDLEIALYNLKTYKRCETEFPEAFAVLPKGETGTVLAVNINQLRKLI